MLERTKIKQKEAWIGPYIIKKAFQSTYFIQPY